MGRESLPGGLLPGREKTRFCALRLRYEGRHFLQLRRVERFFASASSYSKVLHVIPSSCILPYITLGSFLLLVVGGLSPALFHCLRLLLLLLQGELTLACCFLLQLEVHLWTHSQIQRAVLPETRYFRFLLLTTTRSPGSSPQPNDIDYLNYSLAHTDWLG